MLAERRSETTAFVARGRRETGFPRDSEVLDGRGEQSHGEEMQPGTHRTTASNDRIGNAPCSRDGARSPPAALPRLARGPRQPRRTAATAAAVPGAWPGGRAAPGEQRARVGQPGAACVGPRGPPRIYTRCARIRVYAVVDMHEHVLHTCIRAGRIEYGV